MSTLTLDVVRADDLLVLRFELVNLVLDPDESRAPRRLIRTAAADDALVIVHFQPQHIAEECFRRGASGIVGLPAPNEEVRSSIAGPSRLTFRVPERLESIALTLKDLLDWDAFEPWLASPDFDRDEIDLGLPHHTAIELPYRLVLSPDQSSRWHHAKEPAARDGRVALWHTRLTRHGEPVEPNGPRPARVRVISSPDDPFPRPDPFEMALSADERAEITQLSSDFEILADHKFVHLTPEELEQRPRYTPVPLTVDLLILSAVGGWLRGHSRFDFPILGPFLQKMQGHSSIPKARSSSRSPSGATSRPWGAISTCDDGRAGLSLSVDAPCRPRHHHGARAHLHPLRGTARLPRQTGCPSSLRRRDRIRRRGPPFQSMRGRRPGHAASRCSSGRVDAVRAGHQGVRFAFPVNATDKQDGVAFSPCGGLRPARRPAQSGMMRLPASQQRAPVGFPGVAFTPRSGARAGRCRHDPEHAFDIRFSGNGKARRRPALRPEAEGPALRCVSVLRRSISRHGEIPCRGIRVPYDPGLRRPRRRRRFPSGVFARITKSNPMQFPRQGRRTHQDSGAEDGGVATTDKERYRARREPVPRAIGPHEAPRSHRAEEGPPRCAGLSEHPEAAEPENRELAVWRNSSGRRR